MLVHAPDCFVNDGPGMPVLLGLLDNMDHSKSNMMVPTYLFEFATDMHTIPDRSNVSTAADIFTFFNVRACPLVNAARHLVIVDPHMVQVTIVHEAFDGFDVHGREYTASIAVNHYIQLFSHRSSQMYSGLLSLDGMSRYPNGSVDHCVDESMSQVSAAVASLLQKYAVSHEESLLRSVDREIAKP